MSCVMEKLNALLKNHKQDKVDPSVTATLLNILLLLSHFSPVRLRATP